MVNLDIIQITTFFEVQLPYPPYHTHEIEPIEEPNFISGYSSSIDPRWYNGDQKMFENAPFETFMAPKR